MVFTVWLELVLCKLTKQSTEAPNRKVTSPSSNLHPPSTALNFPEAPLPAPIEAVNQGMSVDALLQHDKPPASTLSTTLDTLRRKTVASSVRSTTLKYKPCNLYGCTKPLRLYIYKGFTFKAAAGQKPPRHCAPLLPAGSHL